jgi:hypothetical protein
MARSKRPLYVLGAACVSLGACNLINGLASLQEVACVPSVADCGTSDATGAIASEAGDGGADAAKETSTLPETAPPPDAPEAAPPPSLLRLWPQWLMPNPPDSGAPNPARYDASTVSSVDTVTDQVTNLVWEAGGSSVPVDQATAQAHCDSLPRPSGVWVLPTRIELVSLIDFTRSNPTIDTSMFPEAGAGPYWTSSGVSPLLGVADAGYWSVDFGTGAVSSRALPTTRYVRCLFRNSP